MPLRFYDRLILFVTGVVSLLWASVLFAASLGLSLGMDAANWLGYLSRGGRFEAVVLAVITALITARLFGLSLGGRQKEPGVLKETALGEVRIALRAIETLVTRAAKEVRGIRDVDVAVKPAPGGVEVIVSALVSPDTRIPELSDQVQARVEEAVREAVGVSVSRVHVAVRNIAHETKARVE